MAIRYNQQFKDDAVAFWSNNPSIRITQICKDFGISEPTFYEWRKQARNRAGDGLSTCQSSGSVFYEEHRKLRKRNLELEQENIILKRAATYFAKDALPKGNTLSS